MTAARTDWVGVASLTVCGEARRETHRENGVYLIAIWELDFFCHTKIGALLVFVVH